jgi:hypothetical protein
VASGGGVSRPPRAIDRTGGMRGKLLFAKNSDDTLARC